MRPAILLHGSVAVWLATGMATAQARRQFTLGEAEQTALRNHPRLGSADFIAGAAKAVVRETKAGFYPTMSTSFTSVGAEHNSTLAAGTLQTSSIYSRVAVGITLSQLITDFGRTSNLTQAARLRALAQEQTVQNTRAEVLVAVDTAYYQVLASESVLKVAQAVLENRRVTLRQVRALAESSMKSTLDLSFAEIAVSEAELALFQAEAGVQASRSQLATALGTGILENYELVEEATPGALDSSAESSVADALKKRPDLSSLRLNRDAAHRFAEAEKRLRYPTVSLVGAAGALPATDPRLSGTYSAAGVNVSIPVLNGGLYAARENEAEQRALGADKDVEELMLRVTQEVRAAWLQANYAFRRLDVMSRLLHQSNEALRLAQARYDSGLGSIVELNQAQLSQVSAEIEAAGAKYQYLQNRAELDYATGSKH